MAGRPSPSIRLRKQGSSRYQSRFATDVEDWVNRTKEQMDYIFREATMMTIDEMQTPEPIGRLPYDEGYLQKSLFVGVNVNAPPANRKKKDGFGDYNRTNAKIIVSQADAGDTIVATYTMIYARRLEYGFVGTDSLGRTYNQRPRLFMKLAAQNWEKNVEKAVAEAKPRIK